VGGRSRWRWAIERAQGPAANQTVDFVATKWQKKRFFSKKAGRSNMWPRKISTEEKNCKVYLTKLLGFY